MTIAYYLLPHLQVMAVHVHSCNFGRCRSALTDLNPSERGTAGVSQQLLLAVDELLSNSWCAFLFASFKIQMNIY